MHFRLRHALILLGSIGSLAATSPALAGCGDGKPIKLSGWQGERPGWPGEGPQRFQEPIVGLWSVQFLAGGKMVDFGYAAWHNDGTEILNSGARAPSTENFCLGVWAQVGPFRYKLNHWALSYDPNGTFEAFINIREEVVVNGNTYRGPFTIDAYDPKTKALLQHVAAGTVVGKRVSVNSGL